MQLLWQSKEDWEGGGPWRTRGTDLAAPSVEMMLQEELLICVCREPKSEMSQSSEDSKTFTTFTFAPTCCVSSIPTVSTTARKPSIL